MFGATLLVLCGLQFSPSSAVTTFGLPVNINDHEKVMGAFTELVNSSLFYQSYVPIIQKFRIPDWKAETLRLNKSLVCSSEDMATNNVCPVAFHFESLIGSLAQSMRFYKNVFSPPGPDFYEKNFSCDKIKPHFLHFSAQLGGLLPYLNEYRNRCPLGKNVSLVVKNLASGAAQHAVSAYEKIKQIHDDSAKAESSLSGSGWKFLDMANYAALQNSYLFSQYVDSIRWANAFTSCQAYRLDVGLISPVMLNDSLTEVSKALAGTGYTFSLPFLSSLPHYYKIPLTDCILTMSNSIFSNLPFFKLDTSKNPDGNSSANLIIRVLIPVVKAGVTHSILKLSKIPYIHRDKNEDKVCEITNFQPEDSYLIERNDSSKAVTIVGRVSPFCLTSKLCKVPEATHRQVVDPCVTGIILKNHTLTAQHCFFECQSLAGSMTAREKIFPIFTQLASNRYAITGLSPDTVPLLFIQCNGQTTHLFKPNTNEGVIFVTLPCGCELIQGSKKFGVQSPCNDAISVEHVMEFGSQRKKDDDSIDYTVDSVDAKEFNLTFTDTTNKPPAKDTSPVEKKPEKTIPDAWMQTGAPQIKEIPSSKTQLHCGHVLLWIFLITLLLVNLLTILIMYKNRIININVFRRGATSNISRLTNEIPVTQLGPGPGNNPL